MEARSLEAGGLRFRYLVGGPAPRAGGPTPVLFLHGFPAWAEVWLPVAGSAARARAWFAPDLPNHHGTSLLPKPVSVESVYRGVLAFFDALGLERAVVVGNSLGATLAVRLALERPDTVSGLVLVDGAGFTTKFPGRTVRLYLPFFVRALLGAPGKKALRRLLQKTVFVDPALATDDWVAVMAEGWAKKDRRKGLLAIGFALRRPGASVASALGSVRCRTLVVWGRQDVQFSWTVGEAAAAQIPGARFAPIEGAGHFPQVEKPGEAAALLAAFLGEVDGAREPR